MEGDILKPVYTIGHGTQPWEQFLAYLRRYGIKEVWDVRSLPRSKRASWFDRRRLSSALATAGIKYHYIGDRLGGRPLQPDCYDAHGHVVYAQVSQQTFYQAGLQAILEAPSEAQSITLLCSELDPAQCHRSKLIGASLEEVGRQVWHIDAHGELLAQAAIWSQLTHGQLMWGPNPLRSRKRYSIPSTTTAHSAPSEFYEQEK